MSIEIEPHPLIGRYVSCEAQEACKPIKRARVLGVYSGADGAELTVMHTPPPMRAVMHEERRADCCTLLEDLSA